MNERLKEELEMSGYSGEGKILEEKPEEVEIYPTPVRDEVSVGEKVIAERRAKYRGGKISRVGRDMIFATGAILILLAIGDMLMGVAFSGLVLRATGGMSSGIVLPIGAVLVGVGTIVLSRFAGQVWANMVAIVVGGLMITGNIGGVLMLGRLVSIGVLIGGVMIILGGWKNLKEIRGVEGENIIDTTDPGEKWRKKNGE